MAKILVTGGAGYIGSHMVAMLIEHGHEVVVFDNLVSGNKEAVLGAELIVADLADSQAIEDCIKNGSFDAVMHFAGLIQVGESTKDPLKYYQNNVSSSLNLLAAMKKFNVNKIVFSSSASVYGDPLTVPIGLDEPKKPLNPYGQSKLIFEKILNDCDRAYGLKSISLRYFNVAGADPAGRLGECHDPETHLIPLVLQVASGKKEQIEIFGNDYPTEDGTCIRDYIHVTDLCDAHMLALNALLDRGKSEVYNLGNGEGYSALEVVSIAEQVTGKKIKTIYGPRRAGDPAILVADASAAIQELKWKPNYSDLSAIIDHAWQWEKKKRCLTPFLRF